jgi:hypothetical protein
MNFKERDRWIRHFCKEKLSPTTKLAGVLLAHAMRVDAGQVQMTAKCLADACGICERAAKSALIAIVEKGWVKRTRGAGRYDVYAYELIDRGENPAPLLGANPAPLRGANFAPKNLSEEREAKRFANPAACAAEDFAPLAPNDESEIAYRSDDGAVIITEAQLQKYYADLPGLSGMNVAGMVRHWDMALVAKRRTGAERRAAIENFLVKRHADAITRERLGEAKIKAAANGSKPDKRPYYNF